jgi:hypothetical protein
MKTLHSPSPISGSDFGKQCPSNSMSSSAVNSSNKSARQNNCKGGLRTSPFMFCSGKYSGIPSLHPVGHASDGRSSPAPAKAIPLPGRVVPEFSQRSVGPCRGGSRPDHDVPHHVVGQGVPRPSLWRRLRALNDRIEDCWIGDLIGVAALAMLLVAMSFIVGML